jgi:hypothetical protein
MAVRLSALAAQLQAWSGPEGSRKLRFPDFLTTAQDGGKVVSLSSPVTGLERSRGFQEIKVPWFLENGTGCWQGCQPYAPGAFTPRKYSRYSFLLRGWVDHRAVVRSEGFTSIKHSNDTIWDRTSDLLICSAMDLQGHSKSVHNCTDFNLNGKIHTSITH